MLRVKGYSPVTLGYVIYSHGVKHESAITCLSFFKTKKCGEKQHSVYFMKPDPVGSVGFASDKAGSVEMWCIIED